jgi:hypothetical protein
MLMPSTPPAYSQLASRCFASFRVVKFRVSAVHAGYAPGSIPGSSTGKGWSGSKILTSFLLRQGSAAVRVCLSRSSDPKNCFGYMIERRAALFRVVGLPDGMIYDYVSARSAT